MREKLLILVALTFALFVCGCGRADKTLEPGIMDEVQHSHYHVHALDASHEHAHPGHDALGGHTHSHKHPHNETRL